MIGALERYVWDVGVVASVKAVTITEHGCDIPGSKQVSR